jgi:ABC-type Zn uptake system ZnuABC Zn-binding protein ZnuA
MRNFSALMLLLLLALMAGCDRPAAGTSAAGQTTAAPHYVVTIRPLELIVGEIVAGRGTVHRLIDPGTSSHTYEPRPSDAKASQSATALLFVDRDLDGWATGLPARRRLALFPLVPDRNRVTYGAEPHLHEECTDHDHDHDHDHAHANGDPDPHFWTCPLVVADFAEALAGELARLDPPGADTYRRNAAAMAQRLRTELHPQLEQLLAPIKGQHAILFHPSFNYLFHRYGIVLAGVIEPAPGKEPSPAMIRDLINLAREKNVRALFSEPQLPPRPVQIIAEATGLPLSVLDPIGVNPNYRRLDDLLLSAAASLKVLGDS